MDNPETWSRNDTPKSFFNPLKKDFTVVWLNDKNEGETITIPSLKLVTYPTYKADFIINRLVNEIVLDRKIGFVTPEKKAEILTEILV